MGEGCHQRTDNRNDQMRKEGGTRIKEGAHHNRHNGIRQDINVEEGIPDAQFRKHTAYKNTEQQKNDIPLVTDNLRTERPEIEPKTEHHAQYQHKLAGQHKTLPLVAACLGLIDNLQRAQHIVGMVIDNLSPIDNALPSLYQSTGQRDTLYQIVPDLRGHNGVVGDILGQVIVDVARLERGLVHVGGCIVQHKFVGCPYGEEVRHILRTRHIVLPHFDPFVPLLPQPLQILRRNNTFIIELVQTILDVLHIGGTHLTAFRGIVVGPQLADLGRLYVGIHPVIGFKIL